MAIGEGTRQLDRPHLPFPVVGQPSRPGRGIHVYRIRASAGVGLERRVQQGLAGVVGAAACRVGGGGGLCGSVLGGRRGVVSGERLAVGADVAIGVNEGFDAAELLRVAAEDKLDVVDLDFGAVRMVRDRGRLGARLDHEAGAVSGSVSGEGTAERGGRTR